MLTEQDLHDAAIVEGVTKPVLLRWAIGMGLKMLIPLQVFVLLGLLILMKDDWELGLYTSEDCFVVGVPALLILSYLTEFVRMTWRSKWYWQQGLWLPSVYALSAFIGWMVSEAFKHGEVELGIAIGMLTSLLIVYWQSAHTWWMMDHLQLRRQKRVIQITHYMMMAWMVCVFVVLGSVAFVEDLAIRVPDFLDADFSDVEPALWVWIVSAAILIAISIVMYAIYGQIIHRCVDLWRRADLLMGHYTLAVKEYEETLKSEGATQSSVVVESDES